MAQKNKIFILFIFLNSCIAFKAYFNTFYNAKKIFKEAEESYIKNNYTLNQGIKQGYEKAIQKFLYVIKYYPTSPFLDDALYYLIISYMRIGEYEKAIRKFEEILRYSPKSKFSSLAFLELSRELINKEKNDDFEYVYILTRDTETFKKINEKEKTFYKIFYNFLIEDYENVIKEGEIFLRKFKKIDLKDKIVEIILKSYIKLRKEESAILFLKEFYKEEEMPVSHYLILSDVYISKGDTQRGIEILENVYKKTSSKKAFFKMIEIKKNKGEFIRSLLNDFKDKIKEDSLKQRVLFEIAETYDERDSLEKKEEILKEISKISSYTEYGKKANEYLEILEKFKNLEKKGVKEAKDYFLLAEDYYIKLSKPLFTEYFLKKAIEYNDPIYTPKAYYFLFFLQKEILKRENAYTIFEEFKKRYPKSFYIEEIERRLNVR
ncbi:MAG: tetratricopeptide repeat protein [candidate division WOR-3 bacterium]